MAECILSSTATCSKGSNGKKYRLSTKARKKILSMSDSVQSKQLGKTSITELEIESQRQAFIKSHGSAF